MGAHFIDKFKASKTTASTSQTGILVLSVSSIIGIQANSVIVLTVEVLSVGASAASTGGYSYRQGVFLNDSLDVVTDKGSGTNIMIGGLAAAIAFSAGGGNIVVNITPSSAASQEHVCLVTAVLQRG